MTPEMATQIEYLSRYILAAIALLFLLRCVFSLFRSRPRRETMATLLNLADDSEIDISSWETSIGRSRSCDISLKYGTVSRFHAVLALRKEGWFIFDTESKTGVYLNGEKIDGFANLTDGDAISFGNAVMKFQSNGYGQNAGTDENTVGDFTNATRLVNLADKSAFYLKGPCLIGSDRRSNICLNMPDISGNHAKIFLTRDGWMLTDLGSVNGTKINSSQVFGTFPLYDGDVITIGEYKFMFRE